MPRIGFIGLGAMGSAIARRLVASYSLQVADLRAEAVAVLEADGAHGTTPQRLARECDVVFTCLPRSEDVENLLFASTALAENLQPGTLFIDMTTGDPAIDHAIAARLAPRQITFIDAPVSGGPQAAAVGNLAIMVGASRQVFDAVRPCLAAVSPNVIHAGELGCGHVLKLANNLLSACNRLAALEVVAMAAANGVDAKTCIAGINQSSGRSYITEKTFPTFLLGDEIREQHFTIGLMHKDLTLAMQLARRSGSPSQIGALTHQLFQTAAHSYGPNADINRLASGYL